MCTISVHNLTHIHEDIITFSSPDNNWCAVYERAVKQYVTVHGKTNKEVMTQARVHAMAR